MDLVEELITMSWIGNMQGVDMRDVCNVASRAATEIQELRAVIARIRIECQDNLDRCST